ncbi:MAG: nitroreductase family protein [bacterium]|nr:MAG: nitroreductase family protein [bacterium]
MMPKSISELIQSRRSVRRYQNKPVERDKILQCIEAARLAPSAENIQPWRFIILDDPDIIKGFSKYAFSGIYSPTRFAAKAPVIIVILAKLDILTNRIGKQIQGIHFYLLDIGIAAEHLVLQAQELGLGTCWIGWFNIRGVRKFLKIPRSHKIVSLMSMGYPETMKSKQKKRYLIEDIAWFNGFKNEMNS